MRYIWCFVFAVLLPAVLPSQAKLASQMHLFDNVNLENKREKIYNHISDISRQTGLLFIYDSDLVNNNKVVKTKTGKYSLIDALRIITGIENLEYKIEGRHVLLYRHKSIESVVIPKLLDSLPSTPANDSIRILSVSGTIKDKITGEPVPFATISIKESSLGTVSNLDGNFRVVISDSLKLPILRITHLGYETSEIPFNLLAGAKPEIFLDQKVIPLQEVIVRVVDPVKIIREMLSRRADNYNTAPVAMTAFYREGVEFRDNTNVVEAVLELHKTGYRSTLNSEQVRLLKMRRLSNSNSPNPMLAKFKSGIYSFQQLDLVKNLPDFIDPQYMQLYDYHHSDITTIDDRRVFVISFVQKENVFDVLYKGDLYIDAEDYSLLRAKFSFNPDYVYRAADVFVVRKEKGLDIKPVSAEYDVEYRKINGIYYVSHIRGDIKFSVKKGWSLFSSALKIWFEAVNCNIDTNSRQFTATEKLSVRDIFSETRFSYDPEFWKDFNVILPENDLIRMVTTKLK